MKAIILGAGRIGRGFVTQLLIQNGIEVVFFDHDQKIVDDINQYKTYTIHVMGYPEEDTIVHNVTAYPITDIKKISEEWLTANFIFTAVGGKNLTQVGHYLAEGFKLMANTDILMTSNIITCENWVDPAQDLKEAIYSSLNLPEQQQFERHVGISEGVILTTGASAPDGKEPANPCDTWVQNFKYLPVDKSRLKSVFPTLNYFELIENFGDLLKQKLYTNNTSVALIAYLGYLKGLTHVADAANDPEIEPILDEVYAEINTALIEGLHIDAKSQYAFSTRAKNKYQDRHIIDLISRIARDPIRKLAPTDRLIGPAKILLSINKTPHAITLAIAAALYYDNPDDDVALQLAQIRKQKGLDGILTTISHLENNDPLINLIHQAVSELKSKGWIKEE